MRRFTPLLFSGILLIFAPGAGQGQEEVQAVVSGQLLWDSIPADSGTVVLHRVTPEEAGPVDSVAVGEGGRFTLRLPELPIPGSGATLFAVSEYQGILYFGRVIEAPADLDSLYTIRTFPTEAAAPGGVAFPVRTREIWIEEGPTGWVVTDRFVLANPTSSTYVQDGENGIVWQYPLPATLRDFRVIEAGPATGDVRLDGGRLITTNPVTPDGSYYWIQYGLPSLDVEIPLPGQVETALMIARESTPPISVDGLAGISPEEIGLLSTDRVWFGQGLQDQVVRIRPGGEDPRLTGWLTVGLALVLLLAGVWIVKRSQGEVGGAVRTKPPGGAPGTRLRRDILVEIAHLDETFREGPRSPVEEGRYRRRRDVLLAELEARSRGDDSGR